MKKIFCLSMLFTALISLSGCVTRIGVKDPISFAPPSTAPIPKHLGVVLADGAEHYSLKRRGMQLLVGDAVSQNIGNSLQSVFTTVTVSTSPALLPSAIDNVAYVRFLPGTEFYLPATIFSDIKLTLVIDFTVYDKEGKTLAWATTARGTKAGKQPPSLGLLTIGIINSFYRELTAGAVQAALNDINDQIIADGKSAIQHQ